MRRSGLAGWFGELIGECLRKLALGFVAFVVCLEIFLETIASLVLLDSSPGF